MSDYNINKMDFKQLRNEVQLLRDELAIMQRKYEDILYNLDDDNFSGQFLKEKANMKTSIEQTEKSITLQAEKIGENSENIASLVVTAESIRSEVKEIDGNLENYTTKEQTAEAIKTQAYASVDLSSAIEIGDISQATDTQKTYYITGSDGNKTYYFYSDISGEWEEFIGGLYTVFEQTAKGFKLKGNILIDGGSVTWDSDSSPVKAEYSVDGVSSWHPNQTVYDKYIRFSFDGGETWGNATQIVGDTGPTGPRGEKGDSANVPSYIKSTYIDSTKILSPDIWGGKFYATGKGADGGAAYYISDGYTKIDNEYYPARLLGYISFDDNGAGTDAEAEERVFFTTAEGVALKLHAGGNMSLEADGGTIHFMSAVRFHGDVDIGSGVTSVAVFA